jgi:hypothetical protein
MIMKRSSRPQIEDPGQDSFLDIVANLVGILIILVMVIGARATDAMISVDHGQTTARRAADRCSGGSSRGRCGRARHPPD